MLFYESRNLDVRGPEQCGVYPVLVLVQKSCSMASCVVCAAELVTSARTLLLEKDSSLHGLI